MDKLQTGLATGIAALDKNKPKHPDPALDGKNTLLPLGSTPTAATSSRIKLPTAENVPDGGPAVEVPHICIGTWSWGDRPVWQWDDETRLPLRREALRTLLLDHDHDQGLNLNFIDTAQMYGGGRAEEVVGELLSELFAAGEIQRKDVIVQTKWDVFAHFAKQYPPSRSGGAGARPKGKLEAPASRIRRRISSTWARTRAEHCSRSRGDGAVREPRSDARRRGVELFAGWL